MLKRVMIFFGVILFLGLLSIFYPYLEGDKEVIKNKDYEFEGCFVNRIIDGDTIVCDNQTIRLLGIDTPEKREEYYQEAKDYLMQVNEKNVMILRDWDDLDKYKRKLRYIFYEERLINVEIVEQGLAIAFMTDDLKYEDKFLVAEEFAKESCLGIWENSC